MCSHIKFIIYFQQLKCLMKKGVTFERTVSCGVTFKLINWRVPTYSIHGLKTMRNERIACANFFQAFIEPSDFWRGGSQPFNFIISKLRYCFTTRRCSMASLSSSSSSSSSAPSENEHRNLSLIDSVFSFLNYYYVVSLLLLCGFSRFWSWSHVIALKWFM